MTQAMNAFDPDHTPGAALTGFDHEMTHPLPADPVSELFIDGDGNHRYVAPKDGEFHVPLKVAESLPVE